MNRPLCLTLNAVKNDGEFNPCIVNGQLLHEKSHCTECLLKRYDSTPTNTYFEKGKMVEKEVHLNRKQMYGWYDTELAIPFEHGDIIP